MTAASIDFRIYDNFDLMEQRTMVREILESEKEELLKLYLNLHEDSLPDDNELPDQKRKAL